MCDRMTDGLENLKKRNEEINNLNRRINITQVIDIEELSEKLADKQKRDFDRS